MNIRVHRSRLHLQQKYFSQQIVRLWNKLPESVVEMLTVKMFKKRLDDWIYDVYF